MSGFFLCWHRGGAVVDTVIAQAAREALAASGRRTVRSKEGPDWLALHAAAHDGTGSAGSLPRDDWGWAGSGVVRLDDRESLMARLRDHGAAGADDDASLAWRSLEAWEDAAPSQWMGDYALAAIAPARDRVVIARGTFGVRSCFVASIGPLECVSDDLALLARLPGVDASPRAQAIEEFLHEGELRSAGLTFLRGVERVPASHTLVIRRDGGRRLARHWDFPVPAVRHGATASELIDGLHEVLARALRDRLRAPRTTLLLSGGIDSPALAATAQRAGAGDRLGALTVSWDHLLPDEEPRWAAMAALATGVRHELLTMDPDVGLRFDDSYATPEPVTDAEPAVWRATAARLATLAPVALLGEDVDALLAPPTLAQQLRLDGLRRTASAWLAYRRATGRRPRTGIIRTFRAATGIGSQAVASASPAWIRTRRRPAVDTTPRGSHAHANAHANAPATRADAVHSLTQPTWEALWWQNDPAASGAEVRVLLPYLDPRVIDFAFSLPPVPWLQEKHVFRAAFAASLPRDLVTRPKSALAGYYAERIRRWRALGAPAPLPAAVDEWVDVAQWRSALATAVDTEQVLAAWRVLELSRWLAQPGAR